MFKFLFPLFAPATAIGDISGGTREPMSAEDDLKFLRENQEPDPEPEVEAEPEAENEESDTTSDDEGNESDSEEDLEKTEDEDDEEADKEDEEEEPAGLLVTAKDLKEKYPDIFKKVPELKGVIYREQQYSQIFADPKEAQAAAVDANTFHKMEADLMEGNSQPLFEALKKSEGMDFKKFSSNLLSALKKVDEQTYWNVVAVPLKKVLRSAFSRGTKNGDKNLVLSAQHLHNFIFEDIDLDAKADFEEPESKKTKEQEDYEKKLATLDARDHNAFKISVDDDWLGGVKIAFFDKFDPDNTLSSWMKDKMFESAVGEINKQLTVDVRHMKSMELLWKAAKASGYTAESKSRIVNAALARAKQLIPTIRQKLRQEALSKDKVKDKDGKKFVVSKDLGRSENKDKNRQPQKKNLRDTSSVSELDIIRG